jgi:hypothetical protein
MRECQDFVSFSPKIPVLACGRVHHYDVHRRILKDNFTYADQSPWLLRQRTPQLIESQAA